MNKFSTILFSLAAGLLLGWFTHEQFDTETVTPHTYTSPPITVPSTIDAPLLKIRQTAEIPVDTITKLLGRKEYLETIEHYESLQTSSNSRAVQFARARILSHVESLISSQNFVDAVKLLQGFLAASYRDSDASLLLAEAYFEQKDYLTAIEQLYETRGIAFRPQMLTLINQRIRQVVHELSQQYQKNNDNIGLLNLYQNLSQKEPDYAKWFIDLANTQLTLGDLDSAQYSLTLVKADPDVGFQAQEMLTKLEQSALLHVSDNSITQATGIEDIPLTRKGHNFLVEADAGNAYRLQLLIDTGASMTIVTPDVMQLPGLRYHDTGRSRVFNTANGAVRAPIYFLESLTVGNVVLEQLEVGVLELKGIDGLLGMNFLKHFRFFIDQHALVLRLSLS